MTLDESIRELVLSAVREAVPAIRAELERPRMISIDEAPIARRALVAAERAGELVIFRIGHSALVDETELYAWIRRTAVQRAEKAATDADEIGELISMNDNRRARRARKAFP